MCLVPFLTALVVHPPRWHQPWQLDRCNATLFLFVSAAVAPGAGSEEGGGLFEEPWWAARLGAGDAGWWLAALDARALRGLPARQRVGLLNAAADLLRHLVSGVACCYLTQGGLSCFKDT